MPYLRFSRDKRGYENTFVVQGERRRGKERPRLLYWFRTPPGVKVGRAALDEEAIRLLEELNPEVDFDWTRILKGGPGPEETRQPAVHARRSTDRPRRPEARRREARRSGPAAGPPAAPIVSAAAPDIEEPAGRAFPTAVEPDAEPPEEAQARLEAPPTAAHARLGSEGVSRLRGRYSEVLARITERITDDERREELKSLAERLNPDSWVTEAEVMAGLEEYEGVFESLRAVVGRRKRRRRRGPRSTQGSGEPIPPGMAPGFDTEEAASAREAPGSEDDQDADDL